MTQFPAQPLLANEKSDSNTKAVPECNLTQQGTRHTLKHKMANRSLVDGLLAVKKFAIFPTRTKHRVHRKICDFGKIDEFLCKLRFKVGKTLPVITLVNEHIFLASQKTKLTHGFPRDPDIKCTVVNPFGLAYVRFDGGGDIFNTS